MEFQLTLNEIVQKYGKDIFFNSQRLKALLADYQVEKKYIIQIETFLKTGHLTQIIESAPSQIDTLKQNRLIDNICEDTGYDHKIVSNMLTCMLTSIDVKNKICGEPKKQEFAVTFPPEIISQKENAVLHQTTSISTKTSPNEEANKLKKTSKEIIIQVNKQLGLINAYDDRTAKTLTIAKVQIMASNGDVVAQCAMGDYFSCPEIADLDKAMVWYKKAAESGHAKAQWLYGTGFFNGLGVQKDLRQSEYWFRKSAEQGNAGGQYGLAGYYVANKNYVAAEIWLKKAVSQGHTDAKMMLDAISSWASHQGMPKEYSEEHKNGEKRAIYDNLSKKAISEYINGDWTKALSYLDNCIDENINFLEAYLVRGELHAEMGSYQKALNDFKKVIEIDPNNAVAFCCRGWIYAKLDEDLEKSLADFNKAISLDVNYAVAYANRANMFLKMGEYRKAVRDCTKAIELLPKDSFIAHYNRGLAYANLREFSKAVSDYNDAIEQSPENAEAYARRGMCHVQLGNDKEAIRDLEKFLELDPENINAPLIRNGLKELRSG
ncbi:MAG: tetratricopeptide repeat protein [Nitrososphaerota archaeon]|jgi:tetratricopeptide (TPR) repeat protein|nr:tetratricopeptide repeat protein [Nitrososphaerota archaeon]